MGLRRWNWTLRSDFEQGLGLLSYFGSGQQSKWLYCWLSWINFIKYDDEVALLLTWLVKFYYEG